MGRDKEKNLLDSELRSMTNAASRMNFSSSKTYVNNFDLEKATFNKNTKVAASLIRNVNSRRFPPPNLGKLTTSTGPRELEATTVQVLNSKSFDPSATNFDEKEERDKFNENTKVAACPTTEINSPSASTSNLGRLATLTRPRRHFHFPAVKQSSGEKKCAPLITSVQVPTSWSFVPSPMSSDQKEQSILGATSVEKREFENFNALHTSVVAYLRKNKFNFSDPQIPHDRILSLNSKMFYVVSQDLVNVSSYFQTLFGSCALDTIVELPTSRKIVKLLSSFLKFIYNDPSLIKPTSHKFPGMLKSVLRASQKFEAPTVEKKCTDLLVSTVSPNNVDQMYKVAHDCNNGLLKVRVERMVFKLVDPRDNFWNFQFLIPAMKAIRGQSSRHAKRRTCQYLEAVFDCLLSGSPSEESNVANNNCYLITKTDVDRGCKTKYGHLFGRTDVVGRKVNQSGFGLFLQFMESEDNFDVSQIDSVIKLALLFNMEELAESGKKLILGNLKKNFFIATKIAFLYDLDDLKEKIIELVVGRAGNSTSMDSDSRFVWNSEYFLANSEKFKALPQSLKKNIIVSILGLPDLACAKAHGI